MEQKPGFGFRPTDEELINYYLKNKVIGKTWLVDDIISEINILNYHPSCLSSLWRNKSNDRVYYFFAPKQYKTATTNMRKRSTKTWNWKISGKVVNIIDESGNKIGERQGLVFEDPKAPKAKGEISPWVMHEYQITSLPHHNQDSYVICKMFYKGGKKADISNGNNSSEPSQSLVSDSNTIRVTSIPPVIQVEQQLGQDNYYGLSENEFRTPLNEQEDLSEYPNTFLSDDNNNVQLQDDGEFMLGLPPAFRGTAQHLLSDQDAIMQEEYNDDMLMNTVTATITTASEFQFEQPGQENVYGLSADGLRVPINEQVDLVPPDAFDPNTLFSDYNHPNLQQQTPYNDDFWSGLLNYNGGNLEDVFSDQEFILQENRNDYRPKKSLLGIIPDYSDVESISATSYKGTSSPVDSVGNSNRHFLQTCGDEILSSTKDIQTSDEPSIIRKTQESQLGRCTCLNGSIV